MGPDPHLSNPLRSQKAIFINKAKEGKGQNSRGQLQGAKPCYKNFYVVHQFLYDPDDARTEVL